MKPLPTVPRHLAVAFRSFVASCALTIAATAEAQAPNAPAPDTSRTVAPQLGCRAIRLTEPVKIDGVLDEPVWQNGNGDHRVPAARTRRGRRAEPAHRGAGRLRRRSRSTSARACTTTAPDSILARLSRRDVSIPADRFSVYLDPLARPAQRLLLHGQRRRHAVRRHAVQRRLGGRLLGRRVGGARRARDDQGWTAEMRIPYSQLRFAGQPGEHASGASTSAASSRATTRRCSSSTRRAEGERLRLALPRPGRHRRASAPARSLEILPYVTSKAAYLPARRTTRSTTAPDSRAAGGDLRMPARQPADAQRHGESRLRPGRGGPGGRQPVSDVETFYPEKRPFFVEGAANFRFGNEGASDYWGFNWPEPMFFYSRRIGRARRAMCPTPPTCGAGRDHPRRGQAHRQALAERELRRLDASPAASRPG